MVARDHIAEGVVVEVVDDALQRVVAALSVVVTVGYNDCRTVQCTDSAHCYSPHSECEYAMAVVAMAVTDDVEVEMVDDCDFVDGDPPFPVHACFDRN